MSNTIADRVSASTTAGGLEMAAWAWGNMIAGRVSANTTAGGLEMTSSVARQTEGSEAFEKLDLLT